MWPHFVKRWQRGRGAGQEGDLVYCGGRWAGLSIQILLEFNLVYK